MPALVVAYLFTLRKDRHPLGRAWASYFKGCAPDSFVVRSNVDPRFPPGKFNASWPFAGSAIPHSMHVSRMEYPMVEVRLRLMRAANKASAQPIDWFWFGSESDAPIASCAAAHAHLAAHPGRSFNVVDRPLSEAQRGLTPEWITAFTAVACPNCSRAGISPSDFRHTPGWITLYKDHAHYFLRHEAKLEAAFRGWTWERVVAGIADEAYWGTVSHRHGLQLWDYTLTHMEPGDAKTGHPALFGPEDVPRVLRMASSQADRPRFFARKFQTLASVDTALAAALRRSGGRAGALT